MLSTEMKMRAKNAVQKLDTMKPLISEATSKIISALITSTNRPNVSSHRWHGRGHNRHMQAPPDGAAAVVKCFFQNTWML
jgi:hypothetical protein